MHVIGAFKLNDIRVNSNLTGSFLVVPPQRLTEKKKMRIFSWISCVLVAVTAVIAEDAQPPTDLEIVTTFKPDSCPYQAKKKDHIHVHYVSR